MFGIMTDEETAVPALSVLITENTQSALILNMGLHFEKSKLKFVTKPLN